VAEIKRVFPSPIREKVLEMGCVPGTKVSLALKAPLGDPMAFSIDGYYLSMRKAEAQTIEVELVNEGN
jgi:ferrous iron transport protein A